MLQDDSAVTCRCSKPLCLSKTYSSEIDYLHLQSTVWPFSITTQ